MLQFLDLLRQALQLARGKNSFIDRPEAARAFEQELLHAIIHCTSGAAAEQRGARHAAIMLRLEETLSRSIGQRLTVPALCAEIGTPERTLRMCCAEFLDLSPMRYLLLQRLNKARSALRHADPTTASVAEIARNHHFRELGRFAVTYRAIFGESPSATLHQKTQKGDHALQPRR
ncbi:helix-turn-helix transcriptional regulator [Bradyrhizobium sp. CB2312]|uniref:helix-turn-helix transcriptional regulator n=1 Tax=Bradyrhizobium sp. CB2312 TaxID=3039155 RepID=UPI0024B23162|nr:helix-turn-helix transcriptional regulator [Bradyrhizobium sp. CB2312]WFU75546.1 helix-turn-helix transcriptional regulator [Bradyrhizobium sp. CB2312]